jgi:hypothetical protein
MRGSLWKEMKGWKSQSVIIVVREAAHPALTHAGRYPTLLPQLPKNGESKQKSKAPTHVSQNVLVSGFN